MGTCSLGCVYSFLGIRVVFGSTCGTSLRPMLCVLYTANLFKFLCSLKTIAYSYKYADDMQAHVHDPIVQAISLVEKILSKILDIFCAWMSSNCPWLNPDHLA